MQHLQKDYMRRKWFIRFTACLVLLPALLIPIDGQSFFRPEQEIEPLFKEVQKSQIFPDSKTFVDCIPLFGPDTIMLAYTNLEDKSNDSVLRHFIMEHFMLPEESGTYTSDSSAVNTHIAMLWDYLERPPDSSRRSSLIPLPHPYIVPGGRFREIYYWDSYFTMVGLLADGRPEMIRHMIDNFAYLLHRFGRIPNGNRSYYLSRSQPPFFSLMVDLLAEAEGNHIYAQYRPALEKEYAFWMHGESWFTPDRACFLRLVQMPDGSLLNRYWDDMAYPRPESYREDVATADRLLREHRGANTLSLYRNLRAAAESGWDFSSRWIRPDPDGAYLLHHIHTTDIVPVDLNSLLFHLEQTLAKACLAERDIVGARKYADRALRRKETIMRYCWSEETGFFMDFDFVAGIHTPVLSLAGVYPLFFNLATPEQARRVAMRIERDFLKPGGLVSTLHHTGEQWDAPNGWAPLQWMAIKGLRHYGYDELSGIIATRWTGLVRREYEKSYRLLEKYDVEDPEAEGSGGEYPNQDGFGWTNGVYQYLTKMEID